MNDRYPLSPMQLGMLYNYLSNASAGDYIQQTRCDFYEDLNIDIFQASLKWVINRHTILRTSFKWEKESEPIQIVHHLINVPFKMISLEHLPDTQKVKEIDAYLLCERNEGFDLSKAPLFRSCLFRITKDHYVFIFSHHHIIMDGRSYLVFFRELFLFYEAACNNRLPVIETAKPYRSYIDWIYRQEDTSNDNAKLYWRNLLQGFTSPTPLIKSSRKFESLSKRRIHTETEIKLSAEETCLLSGLAQQNGASLNTVFQTAWAITLSRYCGENDVVFGTVRSCRTLPVEGLSEMVGLFINNLPMRVRWSDEMTVEGLVKSIRSQQLSQRKFDHTPLVKVKEWSGFPAGLPLFDSYIMYDHKPWAETLRCMGETWKNRYFNLTEQPEYPVVITVFGGNQLIIKLLCDQTQFDIDTVERMASHLQKVLLEIGKEPRKKIADIDIITGAEKKLILYDWNETHKSYRTAITLNGLFEEQVYRTPDFPAILFKSKILTYKEFNERANQVAYHLQRSGVGPEVHVGVCMERSIEMVVALYGILKAGGAYVPLDPEYPSYRIAGMIEDTNLPVIISQSHLANRVPNHSARIINLDTDWELIAIEAKENPRTMVKPDNLAYVIFTSGSTGRPKGVMNEHRGIVNRLLWMQDAYNLTESDRVLQKTPYSFDVSVWEFFWPLLFGARLVVAPPGAHKDPGALVNLINDNEITTIHFVPSMLQLFLAHKDSKSCKSLKRVICSGEALSYDLKERFFATLDAELHNLYGPTEAAVDVTYWKCEKNDGLHTVPIGRPVANTSIYILDQQMQPVPIGVAGELYIGGIQVARGYVNRPELTKERFIPDPFSSSPGARLYKTGDLCRYLSNGAIEYLGRTDFQVKIRGLRIELGEIESILSRHPGVRESVVTAMTDERGVQRLIGYIIPVLDKPPSSESLRLFLQEKLPDYMVPDVFVALDSFPLTSSGKTDRKALPKPDIGRPDLEQSFVPPSSDIERKIAEIWRGVLNLDKVGIHDKFFSLGGNSLGVIQTVSKIQEEFKIEIPVAKMLQYPTISSLAQYIAGNTPNAGTFYSQAKERSRLRQMSQSQRKKAKEE